MTSPTSVVLPVKELVQLLHAHHVTVIVDGAQAPGHVDICLDEIQPDFYAGTFWIHVITK